ncbi:TnsD family Tn7-like transposition protein [Ralstonia chuxiongensis]|uniref:TnsD family Tn7-like transposition protein n=1 Tax=Ralstonia chuxiongensis TaxID=2957504 RepID=UPI0028F6123A|nr:hypothetical protein R8510_05178 [Ralstonia chuxiongensis]
MSKLFLHPWLLPPFPIGETVNSYLRRLAGYHSIPSLEQASQRLLARKPGLDAMPSGLSTFHDQIGLWHGSLDALVRDHTTYDFVCCGLPASRHAEQYERVVHKLKGPVRLCRLPVMFGYNDGASLVCPACCEEQLDTFGFTYCDRTSCVPGVVACAKHGCLLRPTDGQPFLFDAHCCSTPTLYQLDCSIQYAARVAGCLASTDRQSEHRKAAVMARLASSGWVTHSGRIRLSPLISTFSAFYGGAFSDTRLSTLVTTSASVELAVRALFRADRAVDPVWCVLFRWFAEQCAYPVQCEDKRCRKATGLPSPERLAELLQSKGSMRAVGQVLSLSVTTVSVACKRYGIEARWRPKRIDAALQSAIKEGLIDGDSPADVASRCGVSLSTVYRILAATPGVCSKAARERHVRTEEAKEAWLRACESSSRRSAHAQRKQNPSAWARLYRNAPEWLREHSFRESARHGAPRATTRSALDATLFKAICSARSMCARRGTLPVHASWYRLRALTGVSEYALRSRTALWPDSLAGESRKAFVRRRIAWAQKNMARLPLRTWAMARLASVRVTTVLEAIRAPETGQEGR